MRIQCLFLLGMIGLSSCQFGSADKKQQPDIFKDTLAYTYQTIHQRAADCGDKADSACTVVQLKYPVFKGHAGLNDTVKNKLLNIFAMDGKPDTSLKQMAGNFLQEYTDFKKTDARSEMFFTLDSYAKVINQDTGIVSLEYGGYSFRGGAHGGSFTGFINWDVKKDENITLDEILVSGYKTKLTKIAEGIFRKNEKLSDTASLEPNYFFDKGKFALNDNYMLTPLGLRYVYNEYEIKPYAAGQTELIIPYAQIKTLIRPDAVVAQYIKKDAGI